MVLRSTGYRLWTSCAHRSIASRRRRTPGTSHLVHERAAPNNLLLLRLPARSKATRSDARRPVVTTQPSFVTRCACDWSRAAASHAQRAQSGTRLELRVPFSHRHKALGRQGPPRLEGYRPALSGLAFRVTASSPPSTLGSHLHPECAAQLHRAQARHRAPACPARIPPGCSRRGAALRHFPDSSSTGVARPTLGPFVEEKFHSAGFCAPSGGVLSVFA